MPRGTGRVSRCFSGRVAQSLHFFAGFVEWMLGIIAVRSSVAVVTQPLVFQYDAQHERDKRDGDNKSSQLRHRILHQAGGNSANREEVDEISRSLVIGLEH